MSQRMRPGFSWLFGRRSYEDMLPYWNSVGGPMADCTPTSAGVVIAAYERV